MNVHVSYKLHKTPAIEKEINHQLEKIAKRLHVFRPDLIHLKVVMEPNQPRGIHVALNLRLPSGQMAAQAQSLKAVSCLKAAFDELVRQIGKHKEQLRARNKWRHWRAGTSVSSVSPEAEVEFATTLVAVRVSSVSADDIGLYVNANLARLERYIERELYFRRAADETTSSSDENGLSTQEVVNEVVARALGDHPEKLALEPWLYRLARLAMDEMTSYLHEMDSSIHLEDSRRPQNVRASDEAALQFHQPDEGWTRESAIADRRISNPEQKAYCDEMVALVQSALRDTGRNEREAFLLYAIEGFGYDEIAAITGRHVEGVRESVDRARDCIRRAPAMAGEFRHRASA